MNHPHHFSIMPHLARDSATGQIFMIHAPNHGVQYSYGIGTPQPITQSISHSMPQTLPQPVSQPVSAIAPQLTQTSVQIKGQTNSASRMKEIKERHSIAHFIGGKLMIETSKILTEKKVKKKKHHLQSQHQQQTQPSQQLPQQQQQQPQQLQQQFRQQQQKQKLPNEGYSQVQMARAEMLKWSVEDVVEFIERHEDIKQYSSKFADDEIDGRALQLMIDRNLNFQVLTKMFKYGPAMKIEAVLSKYKLND